ncbi:F0F1 ATP synthase subunit epsilon [Anaerolineales bacterium]
MPIHVELVTQETKLFEETEADMVLIPAIEGEMGVLPHHAPVLTTLGFGELVIRKGKAEERFVIYGGIVDVRPDKVVILADMAESSFDLDLEKIEEAKDRALEAYTGASDMNTMAIASQSLRRANLAAKVSRKVQSRPSMLRILGEDEQH